MTKTTTHTTTRRARAAGFTLIELLVVIAIIGVLISMMMPAMQSARESTRRLSCKNNMKQVGTAINSYATIRTEYPPAHTDGPDHNLLSFILPQLELQNVYDKIDFNQNWSTAANKAATAVDISTFVCPTAPGGREFVTDYAVNRTYSGDAASVLVPGIISKRTDYRSILQHTRSTPAHVRDGLSNSFMLFEDAGRPLRYTGKRFTGATSTSGARWADREAEYVVHTICNLSQVQNCDNSNETYSFHNGGCMYVFGDASIHFIMDEIDPELYASLFTRAGGDVVSGDY